MRPWVPPLRSCRVPGCDRFTGATLCTRHMAMTSAATRRRLVRARDEAVLAVGHQDGHEAWKRWEATVRDALREIEGWWRWCN